MMQQGVNDTQVTPDTVSFEQDQLLSAGSKISFRDLYDAETAIPIHKKHYYKATDVDNVFIMVNGIVTDVSQHAFRTDKALQEARQNENVLAKQVEEHEDALTDAHQSLTAMAERVNELTKRVESDDAERNRLAIQHKVAQDDAQREIAQLRQEVCDAQAQFQALVSSSAKKLQEAKMTIDQLRMENEMQIEDLKAYERLVQSLEVDVQQKEAEVGEVRNELADLKANMQERVRAFLEKR